MSSSGRAAGASIPRGDPQRCKQAVRGSVLILAVAAIAVLGIVADVVLKLAWAESPRFRCFSLHGDTALRACERVIAADSPPEIRAEGYYNRGAELDNLGRHVEAVLAYEDAVRLKPDYAAAYINMGVTLAKLQRWDDAVRAYRAAIRERPDFGDAHYDLGVVLAGLRRWAEALEAFRETVRLNPADADALYNSGLMLNFLGRHEEAVQAYGAAIRIRPDYADAWGNLGMTAHLLGRHRGSVEAFERARMLGPTYVDGRAAQRKAWEQSRHERALFGDNRV